MDRDISANGGIISPRPFYGTTVLNWLADMDCFISCPKNPRLDPSMVSGEWT